MIEASQSAAPQTDAGAGIDGGVPASRRRNGNNTWTWLGALVLSAALLGVVVVRLRTPVAQGALGNVQPFSLTDSRGASFSSSQLEGKVWVANFIFTRCPTVCPRFTSQMRAIEEQTRELGDRVRFVSFSVDPEHDGPAQLQAYMEKQGVNPARWNFLTGPREQLERVVIGGMKVAMGKAPSSDLMSLAHGTRFVVVDGGGNIRGYHDMNEAKAVARVAEQLTALVQ